MASCSFCVFSQEARDVLALSPTLIACPDCDKAVSRRATFCPACGCPGEAIAEAVKALAEKVKPKPPAERVYGISDRGRFEILPVTMAGRYFLLAPLADAAGVRTLLISNEVHGTGVDYRSIRRHRKLPFVSFQTDFTSNIVFQACPVTIRGCTIADTHESWDAISPKALRKLSKEDQQ